MSTLAEEDPSYPEKVALYLARTKLRRLPWGCLLSGGHLTFTTTSAERAHRAEIGETAIRLLLALGVTLEQLDTLDAIEDATPEALVMKLQELQAGPAAEPLPPPPPPAPPALPSVELGR